MNRLHILLAAVAVVGFVMYPVGLAMTDSTPAQFEESTEDLEISPGLDLSWYADGAMPLFLVAGIVIAGGLVVTWLSPKRWSKGESEE